MRYFIHSTEDVEAVLRKNGLERRFHREMGAWQVVAFEQNTQ